MAKWGDITLITIKCWLTGDVQRLCFSWGSWGFWKITLHHIKCVQVGYPLFVMVMKHCHKPFLGSVLATKSKNSVDWIFFLQLPTFKWNLLWVSLLLYFQDVIRTYTQSTSRVSVKERSNLWVWRDLLWILRPSSCTRTYPTPQWM